MTIPNFQNRTLFQGDNLPFLQGLNSATVDLIATDPPFNKSRDFHATPNSLAAGARFTDRWRWDTDVQPEWVDAIQDDWPKAWWVIQSARESFGPDMAAFLCWLGVRLMECHRILKPTGSLYLHIDHTAHAYAKALLDAIFGRDNFRNEIAWCYRTGGASKRTFARKHDNILFYSKSDDYRFDLPLDKSYLTGQMGHRVSDETFSDEWGVYQNIRFSATLIKLYKDERGYFTLAGCRDYWNIDAVGRTSRERTGYPTQKPLALYERIIQASSNPGDFVLDPFCGCATTPVAAESLGRQWIGMDLWDGCHGIIVDRLNAAKQLWRPEDVKLATTPPERTDDADMAAPHLQQIERRRERRPLFSKPEMKAILIKQWGAVCWGCGFEPPNSDDRHFDLDHNLPKAGGGTNDLDNRAILCRPCNGRKSNTLTLDGLRRANRRDGYWYGSPPIDQRIPLRLAVAWARDYLESQARQRQLAGGA